MSACWSYTMPRARSSPAARRANRTASPPWASGEGTATSVGDRREPALCDDRSAGDAITVDTSAVRPGRRARITGPLAALDRLQHEEEQHGPDEGHQDRPQVELVDPVRAGGAEQRAAEHGADDADKDRKQAAPTLELRDPGGQGAGDEAHDDPTQDAHRRRPYTLARKSGVRWREGGHTDVPAVGSAP